MVLDFSVDDLFPSCSDKAKEMLRDYYEIKGMTSEQIAIKILIPMFHDDFDDDDESTRFKRDPLIIPFFYTFFHQIHHKETIDDASFVVVWNVFVKCSLVLLQDWEEGNKLFGLLALKHLFLPSQCRYIHERGILCLYEKPLETCLLCYKNDRIVDIALECLISMISISTLPLSQKQQFYVKQEAPFLFLVRQISVEGRLSLLTVYWRHFLHLAKLLGLITLKSINTWLPLLLMHPFAFQDSDLKIARDEASARLAVLEFITTQKINTDVVTVLVKRVIEIHGEVIRNFCEKELPKITPQSSFHNRISDIINGL